MRPFAINQPFTTHISHWGGFLSKREWQLLSLLKRIQSSHSQNKEVRRSISSSYLLHVEVRPTHLVF